MLSRAASYVAQAAPTWALSKGTDERKMRVPLRKKSRPSIQNSRNPKAHGKAGVEHFPTGLREREMEVIPCSQACGCPRASPVSTARVNVTCDHSLSSTRLWKVLAGELADSVFSVQNIGRTTYLRTIGETLQSPPQGGCCDLRTDVTTCTSLMRGPGGVRLPGKRRRTSRAALPDPATSSCRCGVAVGEHYAFERQGGDEHAQHMRRGQGGRGP